MEAKKTDEDLSTTSLLLSRLGVRLDWMFCLILAFCVLYVDLMGTVYGPTKFIQTL